MGGILKPDGSMFTKSDNDEDRIIGAFYCGQMMSMHHLIQLLWNSKQKYKIDDIFRFINARYNYIAREYPNFHNKIVGNDKELKESGETDTTYHNLFLAMMRVSEKLNYEPPKI